MEFSDFGQIVPYFDRIYFYTAQFEDMHQDAQVIKVFLGLFATFLLFFIIYNIATTGVGSKLNVYYIFSFQGIQNMMIMVLSYLVIDWIDKYDGLNISKDFLIENPNVQYLVSEVIVLGENRCACMSQREFVIYILYLHALKNYKPVIFFQLLLTIQFNYSKYTSSILHLPLILGYKRSC